MSDTRNLAILGAAGFGYLLFKEVTGPSELAEEFRGARREVVNEINDELEREQTDKEYEQHINRYKGLYAQRRAFLDDEVAQGFPAQGELESDMEGDSLEDRAFTWKSWFLGINDAAIVQETDESRWEGFPTWELVFIAIIYGTCENTGACTAVAQRLKDVYKRGRETAEEYGGRWFGTSAFYAELERQGEAQIVEQSYPDPSPPPQEAYNEPEPEAGEEVGEVTVGEALSVLPDDVANAIGNVLSVAFGATITVTQEAKEITARLIDDNVENVTVIEVAIVLIVFLAIVAISSSSGPFAPVTAPTSAFILVGLAGVIGVNISRKELMDIGPDLQRATQIKE